MLAKLSSQLTVACDKIAMLEQSNSTVHQGTIASMQSKLDSIIAMVPSDSAGSPVSTGALSQSPNLKASASFAVNLVHNTDPNRNLDAPATDESRRKLNVVIYGLEECIEGTQRFQRTRKDLEAVGDLFTFLDPLVTAQLISDCFRLGKDRKDKTRPLLVKFARRCDVELILSQRKKLSSKPGIGVKPDMSIDERKVESILLKERRSLINTGVERSSIKIRRNSLFVDNCKIGSVIDSAFSKIPLADKVPHDVSSYAQASQLRTSDDTQPETPTLINSRSTNSLNSHSTNSSQSIQLRTGDDTQPGTPTSISSRSTNSLNSHSTNSSQSTS